MFSDPLIVLSALLFIHILSFYRWGSILFPLSSILSLLWIYQSSDWGMYSGFFSFVSSDFRSFFAYLVAGLGLLVGIYSRAYMSGSPASSRFFGLMGLFQWCCLLVVFSNHSLLFVSAWELTSLVSFFLIGFKSESNKAQRGAFQALLVTGSGGLCLLGAMVLLSEAAGSYLLTDIFARADFLVGSSAYEIARYLIAAAILTKSAQFPFHFWLPGAMYAPTPISAYLHSATLVKLGLFAAGLFWPLYRFDLIWHVGLSSIGFISFAWGAFQAIFQRDLKSGLAHTTFSQLGLILIFLVQRNELSFQIGCLLILAHSLYKFVLFLSVGVLAQKQDTQDIRLFGNWRLRSPLLCAIVLISTASMAGLPPLLGFVGKELALERLLQPFPRASAQVFALTCFSIGAICTFIYAAFFFYQIFIRRRDNTASNPESISKQMLFSLTIPCLGSLGLGFFADALSQFFNRLSSGEGFLQIHAIPSHFSLALGISLAVIFVSLVISALLLRSKKFWSWEPGKFLSKIRFDFYFDWLFFENLKKWTHRFFIRMEQGFWRHGIGLVVVLFSALILLFAPLDYFKFPTWKFLNSVHAATSLSIFFAGLLALVLVFLRANFVRIFILGLCGYLVAFAFATFGAPDLVLTQVIVESCSLVLLVLAWLNAKYKTKDEPVSPWAWGLSFAFAFLVVAVFQEIQPETLMKLSSLYFFENSLSVAHGQNIVNVVLVDFRGLDTLGEISVLGLAFFGARALYERYGKKQKLLRYPLVTDWMTHLGKLFYIGITLFGLFFLLRGHNYPGGGFIGGLLLSLALFTRMLFFAKDPHAVRFTVFGLLLAYLSALGPGLVGEFFEATYFLGIYTPVLFDTGVFFTVAGALSGLFEILLRLRAQKWQNQAEESFHA